MKNKNLKLEASETLEALLCDPKGNICIEGSVADKMALRTAIDQVKALERFRDKIYENP